MHWDTGSKVKELRMAAARKHRAADEALLPEVRAALHQAASILDAEANGMADDANREAVFGKS